MLVILDGFGWREEAADNAVAQAATPHFDRLWQAGPRAFLDTSGRDVGLPGGQMGNSEVGHLNIGAGRVVPQELVRIGDAVEDGSIGRLPAMLALLEAARASGGVCHLFGLVSDGGVHAHQDHAAALARIVTASGIPVRVHVFTDGRDTGPDTGAGFVASLEQALPEGARVASLGGRYFAMDRDHRWERVSRAYMAMAEADAPRAASAADAIAAAYRAGKTDEFIEPVVIGDYDGMRDGDVLLCFNFRADRVREILAALLDPGSTDSPERRNISPRPLA